MDFNKIKENYSATCSEIEKVKNKIILRQQQIERLEKKHDKLIEKNYVSKSIIVPLLKVINIKYPTIQWGEVYPPMGLRSSMSVFGKDIEDDISICLVFTYTETFIAVDVETNYNSVHGFGSQTLGINCIEDLFTVIDNKIKKSYNKI